MTDDAERAIPQDFKDYVGPSKPCSNDVDCCRHHELWFGNTGNAYRAGEAAAAKRGREALEKYAAHSDACARIQIGVVSADPPCTCGLDAALSEKP